MTSVGSGRRGRRLSVTAKLLLALLVGSTAAVSWAYVSRAITLRTPLPGGEPITDGCTISFVGSSTIRRWEALASDMAPWSVRNRGVDGALLDELRTRFALDGASRRSPAAVLLYAGENDIAAGATPEQTARAVLALVDLQRTRMPRTPVLVVALKPSPARWSMRAEQLAASAMLAREAAHHGARFIQAGDTLLVEGRPGPFYREDGIHLDRAGYRLWSRDVRQQIEAALPPALVRRCGVRAAA